MKNIVKTKRGTYVTRSVYQKLKEENKRLLNDIRIIVKEGFPSAEKTLTIMKWRKKFAEDRELYEMLKEIFNDPAFLAKQKALVEQENLIRKEQKKANVLS